MGLPAIEKGAPLENYVHYLRIFRKPYISGIRKGRNGGVFVEKLPRLPVGVENFEDIRREHFYYVDKTVKQDLLKNGTPHSRYFSDELGVPNFL